MLFFQVFNLQYFFSTSGLKSEFCLPPSGKKTYATRKKIIYFTRVIVALALLGHQTSHSHRVTIIDFRKVKQKGLKNEDKVGQKFILKGGQSSRTKNFEKEDKIGQKSDCFIKCYQRLTSYICIIEL